MTVPMRTKYNQKPPSYVRVEQAQTLWRPWLFPFKIPRLINIHTPLHTKAHYCLFSANTSGSVHLSGLCFHFSLKPYSPNKFLRCECCLHPFLNSFSWQSQGPVSINSIGLSISPSPCKARGLHCFKGLCTSESLSLLLSCSHTTQLSSHLPSKSVVPSWGWICPPKDVWQCGRHSQIVALSGWGPGMPVNILYCTEQPPTAAP